MIIGNYDPFVSSRFKIMKPKINNITGTNIFQGLFSNKSVQLDVELIFLEFVYVIP